MAKDLDAPAISVVMSVYNGGVYLRAAVDSILSQTFQDFELVVIDDGSVDDTPALLSSYQDNRLRIITQANQGLVRSLQRGISEAKAAIIARHDADDISKPTRLEEQYRLLEQHPDVILVGSSIATLDTKGNFRHNHYVLLANPELKQELLVRSPFAHGSVMFRKDAYEKSGGYQKQEWPAEDYGLWLRFAPYGNFANIDAPLYEYRESSEGISIQNMERQTQQAEKIRDLAWKQRKTLLASPIDTSVYEGLPMEHFRIERITRNVLFALRKAFLRLDFTIAAACVRLLVHDRKVFRKCARLILTKLRLKHA